MWPPPVIVTKKDFFTGRIEIVDKRELFASELQLEHRIEHTDGSTFRVQAARLGTLGLFIISSRELRLM
jgi:hypothetical protein